MESDWGGEEVAVIRALPADVLERDGGFRKQMELISGVFDIESGNTIVLGSSLARSLGAGVGSLVNIMAASGSSDTALFSNDRTFIVTGIFRTNYSDINASYCFISLDAAESLLGMKPDSRVHAVKLY
ncbi:MAG: ABC transporter permease, partial [Treponema sp.]|nr:ABC transporter permease [Treponema sp.]